MKSSVRTKNYKQSGISMVEMSIVLTIIAALIAVVSGGVALQKAAELRQIMSDVDKYRVAMESFVDKYSDLPGDMGDAHDYWGGDGVCGDADECNGDSDGLIEWGGGLDDSEALRAWQHLYLSGMISEKYTGSSASGEVLPAINAPATSKELGVWHIQTFSGGDYHKNATQFLVGKFTTGSWPYTALFKPEEAYLIDNKTDDGVANTGGTVGLYDSNDGVGDWNSSTCLSSGDYDTTREGIECLLFFDIQ